MTPLSMAMSTNNTTPIQQTHQQAYASPTMSNFNTSPIPTLSQSQQAQQQAFVTSSYPLMNIVEPHPHDVLCGRGAGLTKWVGNKRWRELINEQRPTYVGLPRNQRPIITESIVQTVRGLQPPGRFLEKDPSSGLWRDIGDERANEKTAQAMRDSKKNKKDAAATAKSSTKSVSPPVSPVRSAGPMGNNGPSNPFMTQGPSILPQPNSNNMDNNFALNNFQNPELMSMMPPASLPPAVGTAQAAQVYSLSPPIERPNNSGRLNSEDSFLQQIQDFDLNHHHFAGSSTKQGGNGSVDTGGRMSFLSTTSLDFNNSNHNPVTVAGGVQPSPSIQRPELGNRKSTFDQKLEQFDLPPSSFKRDSSKYSVASLDLISGSEMERLEKACALPRGASYRSSILTNSRHSTSHSKARRRSTSLSALDFMNHTGDMEMIDEHDFLNEEIPSASQRSSGATPGSGRSRRRSTFAGFDVSFFADMELDGGSLHSPSLHHPTAGVGAAENYHQQHPNADHDDMIVDMEVMEGDQDNMNPNPRQMQYHSGFERMKTM